ncbi:MAG: putative amidophosphoribosyltransferase [Parcubacteria group bacterium Athens0714_26]|nr:MAG: putative amidophosphoribosyltransferase [Parcubacteria group bacterium Athens1014_26]TSD03609.1 MAG: putative amidophosphoribosyltransferase [Parcubacteria group bacterium Athens0714_26]
MELIAKIKDLFLDILFPPQCLNCQVTLKDHEKENAICGKCLNGIILNTTFFCPVCKARLPDNRKICHKDSNYLLAAATGYNNETIKNLIWVFKYKKWRRLKKPLGDLLINYLENIDYDFKDYMVIPIPLHKKRERERGFNQSKLLAEIAAEKLKINLVTNCLKRTKNTKIQAELKELNQRKQNIENCFAVENPDAIKNKNIILVDDVHTSGTTMGEATNVLRVAGAKKIIALVIAKGG